MKDDAQLLQGFAQNRSEEAFRELVERYASLVYSAALRRCAGDTHRAADITQEVFVRLANHAAKLAGHPALAAWLHTATRNLSFNTMKSESRRRQRETDATAVTPDRSDPEIAWEQLRPELDSSIDALGETDRTAVVLRFLQSRSYAEVAAVLRVSEDAARMRTERALEKLREHLARRGITSTAAAIATFASGSAIACPASVSATIIRTVLATAPAVASVVGFSIMTFKTVLVASGLAVAGFVAGAFYGVSTAVVDASPPPVDLARTVRLVTELRGENDRLKAELDQAKATNAALTADRDRISREHAALVAKLNPGAQLPVAEQQRHILSNLRMLSSARDQFELEHGRAPTSVDDLIGLESQKYIRSLPTVNGEDYSVLNLAAGQPFSVITKDGVAVTYDPNGKQTTVIESAARKPDPAALARSFKVDVVSFTRAWNAYLGSHNNAQPPTPESLLPYFSSAKEGADFAEALEARKQRSK